MHPSLPAPRSRAVRRLAAAVAGVLAAALLTAPAPVAGAAPDKLQPAARQTLAGGRTADLIVELVERADLRPARELRTHAQRTAYGQRTLAALAERSQRGIRQLLTQRKVGHHPFWIVNAVHVEDADAKLAAELARRPEVRTVRTMRTFQLPEPTPAQRVAAAAAVEWNIDRIQAPQVWSRYGVRGEGIVVANIDSGVQFDHPALVRQYRGNVGDGVFDHRFNWYDPYGQCRTAPCDTNGHGTHTMGTMVGDDGAGTQIGVAPGARWVAARGCIGSGCTELALLLAGEWVMAPFDDTFTSRPDLAPHIVNNSWGSPNSDPFYSQVVSRWIEVGIMPVFSAGNSGPGCDTVGSPADYTQAYAVAAFDAEGAIADFSSRGTAAAEIKPDIAAPGVAVVSSLPGGRYEAYNGTSMAAPHVSGAVALLWSAAPELIGDIPATRALLDGGAVDVADAQCGGTAADNPVWGKGRLDVHAAVAAAPRGPRGTLTGTVRGADGPVAGASVRLTGPNRTERVATTDATGRYTVTVPPGGYTVAVKAFGFGDGATSVTVTADSTATADLTLVALPRHPISGVVRDPGGVGAAGIAVKLLATPLPPVVTGPDGAYRIDNVPVGGYTLTFGAGRCLSAGSRQITVDGSETVDLYPPAQVDSSGYQCNGTTAPFPTGTTALALTGDDESVQVNLPFPVPFYGRNHTTMWVATNGFLSFDRAADNSINREVPNPSTPNASVFAFWDDLVVDAQATVRTASYGTAPDRRFVVEWRNVTFWEDETQRVTFAAELSETGAVTVHYGDLTSAAVARGAGASVGVENQTGSVGLEYSRDVAALRPHSAITFRAAGSLYGTVTKPDGSPAANALVSAVTGDAPAVTTTAAADGTYVLHLPLGTYTVDVSLVTFGIHRSTVVLDTSGERVRHDVRLSLNERTVSGVIRDSLGQPVRGAEVWLSHSELPIVRMTTGADGAYRFTKVPESDVATYVYASVPGCQREGRLYLPTIIGGDAVNDVTVIAPMGVVDGADGFGYQCLLGSVEPSFAGTTVTTSEYGPPTAVALPFEFRLYGQPYRTAYVSRYGYLTFEPSDHQSGSNNFLPSTSSPDAAVYAFWDGLAMDASSRVTHGTAGTAPNRRFMVSWQDMLLDGERISVDAVLHENGRVDVQHRLLPDTAAGRGDGATVGIEDADSYHAQEYSYHDERLRSGQSVRFLPPGTVTGVVTDATTGAPLAGATVEFLRLEEVEEEVVTDAGGTFTLRLPLGEWDLAVNAAGHFPGAARLRLDAPYGTVRRDVPVTPIG
ncbi:carboxypeptidase regulatory-like domain-containing protein [Micromonospora sp. C28SCA-DRY-2]|uniref:carboxypeptidase regulatory-like domain-containing protein n=1 Tax=Micromonospora sp. C28SCA-DRY-2 TaxID=3059522 RepID=UPI0026751086|nr:carboxypeptidase regulatory-like domain-containing protein [Micromonospora sp. C28SCA-DRY-2]MDO3700240.1 carboxypeptidase regulatory-like domain-containing protein [Micromonospora sp. C28SCA-DRY-2]